MRFFSLGLAAQALAPIDRGVTATDPETAMSNAPPKWRAALTGDAAGQPFPVSAGSLALAILATVAFLFALQWAKNFFIPLVFSVLISYTLTPVVHWLERIRIPRIIAVSLIMATLLCGAAVVANSLRADLQSLLVSLPDATQKIARAISRTEAGQPSTMQQMQTAATEIENAASDTPSPHTGSRKGPLSVVVERPAFKVQEWLLAESMAAAGVVGQGTMVLFLIFFMLLSGDSFKRKLVRITGPALSSKKITVQILDAINDSIQRYMFMLLLTNMLLSLVLWGLFRWIGLDNAGAWAVAAGCLHIIPYFGPIIIAGATGLIAFMQFGTLAKMFLVSGSSLLVAMLVGTFITTWMTGRIAKMNAAAVFIALLFFGWLWGVWGMLLGAPIIVLVRVVAEHVDGLGAVAELLGD